MSRTTDFFRFRHCALLAILFALSACSHISGPDELRIGNGDVLIDVPASLEILSVNGESVTSPSKMSGSYPMYLPQGSQRLEIQYSQNWNDQEESGNFIQWRPVLLTADLQAGQRYQINYRRPNTKEQARAWKDTPEIWLETATSQNTGINKSNDSDAGINTTDKTDNPPITTEPTKIVAETLPEKRNLIERLINNGSTSPKAGENADNPVLTGLKFYWQQASEAEREQFLIWLNQQP